MCGSVSDRQRRQQEHRPVRATPLLRPPHAPNLRATQSSYSLRVGTKKKPSTSFLVVPGYYLALLSLISHPLMDRTSRYVLPLSLSKCPTALAIEACD
eukprot:2488138-Rhodomonas_salina.1